MSVYGEFKNYLDNSGYNLDDYTLAQQGQIIHDFIKENKLQVPQFKDNRKFLYRARGYKVKDALDEYRNTHGGEIYMSYVHMGDMPLRSPETVRLARKLESKLLDKDIPRRVKIEHGLTRNNLIHTHFIYPSTTEPLKEIKLGSKVYPVETVTLGQVERWKKYPYDEQLQRAVTYLYKPGNVAGLDGHNRQDIKYQAYLEWYLEQEQLAKLTRNQIKKQVSRTAWNKNIKGGK